ncbi:MAG: DUF5606 domain-containing protein [Bacteroidales bacterium]|nr:DUF5606 domain-containing protein [Bacteroidales bacterium]
MALKDILSISGKGGLFKFVSQGRNGIIVEGLTDKKRTHVSAAAKISALEDIAIFTDEEEVPLASVLLSIKEKHNGGAVFDAKKAGNEELKAFLADVLPNYDRERVYVSDIKKLVTWYNLFHQENLFDLLEKGDDEKPAESEPEAQAVSDAEVIEEVKNEEKE